MNCIVLCTVGEERGLRLETGDSDWGSSHSELQMALRKPIKPAYTLSASRSHALPPSRSHTRSHARPQSYTHNISSLGGVHCTIDPPSMWLECSAHTHTRVCVHILVNIDFWFEISSVWLIAR